MQDMQDKAACRARRGAPRPCRPPSRPTRVHRRPAGASPCYPRHGTLAKRRSWSGPAGRSLRRSCASSSAARSPSGGCRNAGPSSKGSRVSPSGNWIGDWIGELRGCGSRCCPARPSRMPTRWMFPPWRGQQSPGERCGPARGKAGSVPGTLPGPAVPGGVRTGYSWSAPVPLEGRTGSAYQKGSPEGRGMPFGGCGMHVFVRRGACRTAEIMMGEEIYSVFSGGLASDGLGRPARNRR